MLHSTGRPAEAKEAHRRAMTALQELVDGSPDVPKYRDELAANHIWLGESLTATGNRSEAEAECRTAMAGYQKLVDDDPDNAVFRTYLARSYHGLGVVLRLTGRRAEAMESYRRALDLRERLASEQPSDAEHQGKLGETLNDLALCEMSAARWTEAQALLTRAIEHQRKALSLAPETLMYRQLLREHLLNVVKVYRTLAHPTDALRTARELAEMTSGNPGELYDVACALSLTISLTSGEAGQSVAAEAVAMLEQAVAAGWRDAVRMAHDSDLIPLRDRDDFRRLVAALFDRGFPRDPIAPVD